MKLFFPSGEHAPFELKQGTNRVGSAYGVDVLLQAPGIAFHHCELEYAGDDSALVRLANPQNRVILNGRQVTGEITIKPGDLILFETIGARVMSMERTPPPSAIKPKPTAEQLEDNRTRVRQALPKFVLRGISGSTFGKVFPLTGTLTIGRSTDCDICIPGEEVSRHHAKLHVLPDGISVEDMGSANGTFVNDKRVHQGILKAGEELRLDNIRFMLVAPGMDVKAAAASKQAAARNEPQPEDKPGGYLLPALALVALLAVAGGVAYYFGAFGG